MHTGFINIISFEINCLLPTVLCTIDRVVIRRRLRAPCRDKSTPCDRRPIGQRHSGLGLLAKIDMPQMGGIGAV